MKQQNAYRLDKSRITEKIHKRESNKYPEETKSQIIL